MTEPRIVYLREGAEAVEDHTRNYLAGLFAGILLTVVVVALAWTFVGGSGPDGGEPVEEDDEPDLEPVNGDGDRSAGRDEMIGSRHE